MEQARTWHGRLYCQYFFVETHLVAEDGSWSAWVAMPHEPTHGTGRTALSALVRALEPFEGMTLELLRSAPPSLVKLLEHS